MNVTGTRDVHGEMDQGKVNLGAEREMSIKQVTVEAQRVLDLFLSITNDVLHRSSFAERMRPSRKDGMNVPRGSESDVEHQYAFVDDISVDQLPTPYQVMESDDVDDDDDEESAKESKAFVDNFKRLLSTESTYVDCQMLGSFVRTGSDVGGNKSSTVKPSSLLLENRALKGSPALSSVSGKNAVSVSPRYSRNHSPPGNVKYAIKRFTIESKTANVVAESKHSIIRKGSKTKTASSRTKASSRERHSSSSCSEDYEETNAELLKRNKKSRFRLAVEHFQQSFPWSSGRKKSLVNSIKNYEQRVRSKSDVPLPAPPGVNKTEDWLLTLSAKSRCKDLVHRANENSLSVHTSYESIIENRSSIAVGLGGDSNVPCPVPWSKRSMRDVRKGGADEMEKDLSRNEGIFDGILRHLKSRRGKLRRHGDQILSRRCRSADNVFIRPLSKDNIRLIEQFRRTPAASKTSKTNLYSTAKSHIVSVNYKQQHDPQYFKDKNQSSDGKIDLDDLVTPWLVCEGREDEGLQHGGHYSERERMTLKGLQTSRPRNEEVVEDTTLSCVSSEHGESVSLDFDVGQDVGATSSAIGTPEHGANWYAILEDSSSKSFQEKDEREKDELFGKIAEHLAFLAIQSETHAENKAASPKTNVLDGAKAASAPSDSIFFGAASDLQTIEKVMASMHPVVTELLYVTSYQKFQQILSETIGVDGNQIGWDEIARTFGLTRSVILCAGIGSEISRRIKEMTLRYFEDEFANWIVKQGGWESMIKKNNTEMDSELN